MSSHDIESEAKFYIQDVAALQSKILACGARRIQDRSLELNYRFDTPSGELQSSHRVLRLRKSVDAILTFKGSSHFADGILSRTELEVKVDDFEMTARILEALDYRPVFIYEKFRTVYTLDRTSLMMDDLPYGHFLEIEGEAEALQPLAKRLGLKWENAIPISYHDLFKRVKKSLRLAFRDLTFENFSDRQVQPSTLGVQPADI